MWIVVSVVDEVRYYHTFSFKNIHLIKKNKRENFIENASKTFLILSWAMPNDRSLHTWRDRLANGLKWFKIDVKMVNLNSLWHTSRHSFILDTFYEGKKYQIRTTKGRRKIQKLNTIFGMTNLFWFRKKILIWNVYLFFWEWYVTYTL